MNGPPQNIRLHNIKTCVSFVIGHKYTLLFFGFFILSVGFFLLDKSLHRTIFYIVLAGGLYITWSKQYVREFMHDKMVFFLCNFIIFSFASLIWSEPIQADRVAKLLKGTVFGFSFLYVCYACLRGGQNSAQDSRLLIYLSYGFIAGCFLSIIISYGPLLISLDFIDRPGLILRGDNPNIAGFLIGVAILLLIWINTNFYHVHWRTWWQAGLCFMLLVCLFVTQSRAAILGVFVATTLCVGLACNWRLIFVLTVSCLLAGVFVFVTMYDELIDIVERGFNNRLSVWGYGIEAFTEHLFIGRGAGELVDPQYKIGARVVTESSVHNIFIGIAMDTGIVGLLLFLSCAGIAVHRSYILFINKELTLPLCLLVYGFVVGCFEFNSYVINLNREWLVWWVPLALILAYNRKDNLNKE